MVTKWFTVALPLFEAQARASEALEEAHVNGAAAVVSTDGTGFWLHQSPELIEAVTRRGPLVTFGELPRRKLSVLSTSQAADYGLDFFHLDEKRAHSVFDAFGDNVLVTSVVSNFAGDRLVMALADPTGASNLVTKKWMCPAGGEAYPYSGICPTHGVPLIRG